ncbi:MAG: HAMP domain-containing histidine kinase [Melioribacter sp.]|nr:HAMP domain-containing histidine kinase [Melioribacter sp.]
METNEVKTYFDTPERSSTDEIIKDYLIFHLNPLITQILEGFPELAVIINKNRQIVAYNKKAVKTFNVSEPESLLGKRVGEAINCIYSNIMPAGCGTAQFCKECGLVKAIKHTYEYKLFAEEECKITAIFNNKEYSFEFLVNTQLIKFKDEDFILFAVKDISSIKRKEALERIFFHDILNTASAIDGITKLLMDEKDENEKHQLILALNEAAQQLLNEIISQRDLRNAEDGKLGVDIKKITIVDFLKAVYEVYRNHELAKNKNLVVEYPEQNNEFESDRTLLLRSIGNLIKNALEASNEGDNVKIYSYFNREYVYFNVYNNQVIPENVQLHLFQRSFSTKGVKGRGLGLYSVKLIIEQYLKGKVTYVSNELLGTIFTIQLPIKFS